MQAGRPRIKLAEYYATEGVNDLIVVRIPKGSYHLVFETKQARFRKRRHYRRRDCLLPRMKMWSRFRCWRLAVWIRRRA